MNVSSKETIKGHSSSEPGSLKLELAVDDRIHSKFPSDKLNLGTVFCKMFTFAAS